MECLTPAHPETLSSRTRVSPRHERAALRETAQGGHRSRRAARSVALHIATFETWNDGRSQAHMVYLEPRRCLSGMNATQQSGRVNATLAECKHIIDRVKYRLHSRLHSASLGPGQRALGSCGSAHHTPLVIARSTSNKHLFQLARPAKSSLLTLLSYLMAHTLARGVCRGV